MRKVEMWVCAHCGLQTENEDVAEDHLCELDPANKCCKTCRHFGTARPKYDRYAVTKRICILNALYWTSEREDSAFCKEWDG